MGGLKVTILGNSVALRVRPPLEAPDNKNYSSLLREFKVENESILVENQAKGASTVKDVFSDVDTAINSFPDYFILNIGVVDACSREVPLWFYKLVISKKRNVFHRFLRSFYFGVIPKIRRSLCKLRFQSPWISQLTFEKYFLELITTLEKETNAQFICLSITRSGDRIEKQLPGSRDRQMIYNQFMSETCKRRGHEFINTDLLLEDGDYPDGVHYSVIGHQKIAEELLTRLRSLTN